MQFSTVVLTYNEERNIARCLASLAWCDDILVIDSGSSDDTVAIATSFGARVMHRPFDNFANQRNFALDEGALRHEWVLHFDADEVATPAFVEAIHGIEQRSDIIGYLIPSKTIIMDQWIRHAGMWPSYQVRIGHRDRLRFKQVGHGQREDAPPEAIGVLDEPYLHYNFSHGLEHWLAKHIRYARDEAELMRASAIDPGTRGYPGFLELLRNRTARRRFLKSLAGGLPYWLRPMARFIYIYILRRGFLDGRAGLAYALMLSVYEGMIAIFMYEQRLIKR